MESLRKKLRSRSGVTIVFALAVFLIVTVVSAAMVTGALSAVQSASRQQAEEQAYLSASSAAGLLEKCLADSGTDADPVRYIAKVELKAEDGTPEEDIAGILQEKKISTNPGYRLYPANESRGETYSATGGTFRTDEAVLYALCGLLDSPDNKKTAELKFGVPAGAGMAATAAALTLNADNSVTAVLRTPREGLPDYLTTLTFPCSRSTFTDTRSVPYEVTVTDKETETETTETAYHQVVITTTIYRWTAGTAQHGG